MSLQVNVKDLLSNLYHNRGVIELLFGQRDHITVNELLGRDDITDEHEPVIKPVLGTHVKPPGKLVAE